MEAVQAVDVAGTLGLSGMLDWTEAVHDFLNDSIDSFAIAAFGLVEGAFQTLNIDGEGQSLWYAVVGGEITITGEGRETETVDHPGMLNIVVMAMLPVLFIFVALQMIMSVVRGSSAGFLRACAALIFSVPSVYVVTGLVFMAMTAADGMTNWILNAGSDESDGARAILHLFGIAWSDSGEGTADGEPGPVLDENYVHWEMRSLTEAPGRVLLSWVVAAVVGLCSLFLALMMGFRTVMIIVLTTFTPAAMFSLGFEAAKNIFSRWCSIIIALIIAQPAAAVVVRLGAVITLMSNDWLEMAIGVVLFVVAGLMPVLMMSVISFMSGGADDGMDKAGLAIGGAAQAKATRATSRMVARPAMKAAGAARRGTARALRT